MLLVDKGGFEPQEALAIAEGVDMAIVQSQLVTVPILDACALSAALWTWLAAHWVARVAQIDPVYGDRNLFCT